MTSNTEHTFNEAEVDMIKTRMRLPACILEKIDQEIHTLSGDDCNRLVPALRHAYLANKLPGQLQIHFLSPVNQCLRAEEVVVFCRRYGPDSAILFRVPNSTQRKTNHE